MKNKKMNGFLGLLMLFFVAFLGFTTTIDAQSQYVSKKVAIHRIKTDILSQGQLKGTSSDLTSAKVSSNLAPADYAVLYRKAYLTTLLDKVGKINNVAAAIEANSTEWNQKANGVTQRSSALPILKEYVINLLKA